VSVRDGSHSIGSAGNGFHGFDEKCRNPTENVSVALPNEPDSFLEHPAREASCSIPGVCAKALPARCEIVSHGIGWTVQFVQSVHQVARVPVE